MADAKLTGLPAGVAIADADLFYSAQSGSSVRQAASAFRTYVIAGMGGPFQPLDTTLTAFAAYNTNGLLTQTAADTFTGRTLTGPVAGIAISNGNGVAGNPTLALANDLAALEALAGTNNIYYRSGVDTWSPVTFGPTVTFGGGVLDTTGLAPLASPTFTGDPKAPTPATADNDTSVATTAFVQTALQPVQQAAAASGFSVSATTDVVNCNITSGSPTCTLPPAAGRVGKAVAFKDVGAQFGAHPLTISGSSGELIEGVSTLVLNVNRQYVRLRPFNDGSPAGWYIER